MYSEHSAHSSYINVPYRLVKRYVNDKDGWDLLVFAICLKLIGGHSGMYMRNAKDLMKVLHCSYSKARRLMRLATSDNVLFRYNAKTTFIVARPFRIGCKEINSNGKHTKVYYADDVFVVEKGKDGTVSHREISVQLRDLVIKMMLRTQTPSDDLGCQDNRRPEIRKPLTQAFIGNCAGLHQTTVSRRLKRMADNKEIGITSHPKILIADLETGENFNDLPPHRKPFVSGRYSYIRDVNDYEILDSSIHFRFKHLIYNHKKRFTENKIINPWDNCHFH